jgi:GTPase involved in cell partitioning and DNA repair
MKCDKSEDYLELESRYSDLLKKYNSLEEKLSVIVENILEKKNEDSFEKVEEKLEKSVTEEVIVNDVKVVNPSEHISEKETEQKMTKKPVSKLGAFEQSIVDTYTEIKAEHGEISAENYLASKANYLPRGFHPNKL